MDKNQTRLEKFLVPSVTTTPNDDEDEPTRDRETENDAEPATDPSPLTEEDESNKEDEGIGDAERDNEPDSELNPTSVQIEKGSSSAKNDGESNNESKAVTTPDPTPDTQDPGEEPGDSAVQCPTTKESLGEPISLINVDFQDLRGCDVTLYGRETGAHLQTTVDEHTTTTWFDFEDPRVINQHIRFTVSDHIKWTASKCTRTRMRAFVVIGEPRGYQIIEPVLHENEVRVDTERERRYRRTHIPGVEERIVESKDWPRERLIKKSIKLTRELVNDHCEVRIFREKITEQTGPSGCTRTTTGRYALLSPPRDALLDEFTQLAVKLGDAPTKKDVREYGAYSPTVFLTQFDSWDELVNEAEL